jgi:predicted 3-demethylubiquinone-9 3-methyltransferase (glyoxalase superfamily)
MTLPIREDLSIVSGDGGLIPARRYDLEGQDGWRQFETSAAADQLVDHCYGPTLRRAAFALIEHKEHTMKSKNTICLWFDKDAHEAARFYSATFPDSEITAVHEAPADYPSGKKGDVLTVQFTVLGIPCLGLNGGPMFKHTEAFSFQIVTENQEETDRYWNAIVGNGGTESQCGWCKDRWGLSWQITPRALTDALAAGGGEAKRAFEAMMKMKNIDIAAIEAARRG